MNYNNFINKDFRSRTQTPQNQRHNGLRWLLFIAGCAVIGAVLASTVIDESASIKVHQEALEQSINAIPASDKPLEEAPAEITNNTNTKSTTHLKLPLPGNVQPLNLDELTSEDADTSSSTANQEWQELKVKSGDSLSVVFDRANIRRDQIPELMKQEASQELLSLHPGDIIKVLTDTDGRLVALNYQIDMVRYLQVDRQGDALNAQISEHEIEVRTAYANGEIESSLFQASASAGISENLTMELANIFGWDIDFALDIRKGDRFTIIYEQRYKDGQRIKDGNILAAEFINQGKTFRALRYTDPVKGDTGYYSPDGHSLRKAFLRSPVNFSRISSRFSLSRYHPILHKFRSHKGVDYAAGRGTPVRASGDGKIVFKGIKGGYGRTIIIKHGSRYTTLYAHLNSYNRKIRNGGRVKQGQVIGYVGSSGLASGPHLHYEFRVNGVHRNPLTVKFPNTEPIAEEIRDNFELSTKGYLAQLDVLSRNTLALNDQQ